VVASLFFIETEESFYRQLAVKLRKHIMKLQAFAAAAMLFLSGTSFAGPTDLGAIDANATEFGRNFGRIFGLGNPVGPFTDYYTFSIASAATATGGLASFSFGSVRLDVTEITLSGGSLGATLLADSTPGSFSFSELGVGTYTFGVSGDLRDVGLSGFASYRGSIAAISAPVPEADTGAMLLAGLLATTVMGLRRKRQAAGAT
jgi:hypothetical protein